MAHIPMDDTETLWSETTDRSWAGLGKTLEAHKGKTNGISDELIDLMMQEVRKMESAGTPYPTSAEELNRVLNENLPPEA